MANSFGSLSHYARLTTASQQRIVGTARDEAVKAVRARAQPGPRRVFIGKNADKASTVSLADANGKPRLVMTVGADGNASIDFLDADGQVTQRIPAAK